MDQVPLAITAKFFKLAISGFGIGESGTSATELIDSSLSKITAGLSDSDVPAIPQDSRTPFQLSELFEEALDRFDQRLLDGGGQKRDEYKGKSIEVLPAVLKDLAEGKDLTGRKRDLIIAYLLALKETLTQAYHRNADQLYN